MTQFRTQHLKEWVHPLLPTFYRPAWSSSWQGQMGCKWRWRWTRKRSCCRRKGKKSHDDGWKGGVQFVVALKHICTFCNFIIFFYLSSWLSHKFSKCMFTYRHVITADFCDECAPPSISNQLTNEAVGRLVACFAAACLLPAQMNGYAAYLEAVMLWRLDMTLAHAIETSIIKTWSMDHVLYKS